MGKKIKRETLEKFLYSIADNMSEMIRENTERKPLILKSGIASDGTSLYTCLLIGDSGCRYVFGYFDENDEPVITSLIWRETFEDIEAFAASKKGKKTVVSRLLDVITLIGCDGLFTGKNKGKKKKRRKTWISVRKN